MLRLRDVTVLLQAHHSAHGMLISAVGLRDVTVLLGAHHSAHRMRISALCRSVLEPFLL